MVLVVLMVLMLLLHQIFTADFKRFHLFFSFLDHVQCRL